MAIKAWMLDKFAQNEDVDALSVPIAEDNGSSFTESKMECDENVLYDVNACVPSGTLGRFITHDIFNEPRAVKTETRDYAIVWNLLNEKPEWRQISYGTKIFAYHFRLADVCKTIRDGFPYKGRVRVGIERMPNFPTVRSDKLDVVIYDHEGGVIAKIRANDWSADDVRKHIGDTTDTEMLFCDRGGHYNVMFLHMLVVWHSDVCPYHQPSFTNAASYYARPHLSELVKVTAPEALSDLMVGESFEAFPINHFGEIGLSRQGYNYEFAELPPVLCESYSKLAATGYPMTIPCINRGMVRTRVGWADMVEITIRSPSNMSELARFRDESGLDVRFGDDYEVIRLEPVDTPYKDIPFGDVVVEYVPIPLPGRKNPLVEFHVNGVKLDSARYGDGQRIKGGSKYTLYRERAGRQSQFARLHYDEKDIPYLDVIWSLDETANRETIDDEKSTYADDPDGKDER